jgi:hypothetical protein
VGYDDVDADDTAFPLVGTCGKPPRSRSRSGYEPSREQCGAVRPLPSLQEDMCDR